MEKYYQSELAICSTICCSALPKLKAVPQKKWVRRAFTRSAPEYDYVAQLQRNIGHQLLSMLEKYPFHQIPGVILDAGCGTGYFTVELHTRYSGEKIVALDISEGMLKIARKRIRDQKIHYICADVELLPFQNNSINCIYSNLSIQWCPNIADALYEFYRVLTIDGIFLFSTFGTDTLCELRHAWAHADNYSHVNDFYSVSELSDMLKVHDFSVHILEEKTYRIQYHSVLELMDEIKRLGAHNVTINRPSHLIGKKAFQTMIEAYAAQTGQGRIQATFQTILGMAVKV